MRRNWMIGVAVGVLVAASLLIVGVGAYNAGQRNAETVEVVTATESAGRTVLVPVDGWHGGWGPGFLVFPLIAVSEFELLAHMALAPDRVFTRGQLLEALHGVAVDAGLRAIDAHVKNIRRKIEPDPRRPRRLLTVHGVGYRLVSS